MRRKRKFSDTHDGETEWQPYHDGCLLRYYSNWSHPSTSSFQLSGADVFCSSRGESQKRKYLQWKLAGLSDRRAGRVFLCIYPSAWSAWQLEIRSFLPSPSHALPPHLAALTSGTKRLNDDRTLQPTLPRQSSPPAAALSTLSVSNTITTSAQTTQHSYHWRHVTTGPAVKSSFTNDCSRFWLKMSGFSKIDQSSHPTPLVEGRKEKAATPQATTV